jgi:beta-N-acetylhexosaminidase
MSELVASARKSLGQVFLIGFNGVELSAETAAFLSEAGIGGVTLFAQNYESPAQVAELCNEIQSCRGELPLWICVDHEGGRVQRFKKGFTPIPGAGAVSAMDSPRLAFEIAEVMARELKAVGVNVNFAPVCDVNSNPKNPVIGSRAYGSTEEQVSKMTSAIVRGHLVNGIQPVAKHFPGHGDTSQDSHFLLPRVDTELEVLQERELKPFGKAFKSRCQMVMTAHILTTKLDPELPATLSSKILQELLRGQLRFSRGLIISDDLEMKAITDHYGAEDAPRLALEAGCDLLIYRTEAAARAAYEALGRALDSGKLSPERVLDAAGRSLEIKKEVLLPYQPVSISEVGKTVGIAEHAAIVARVDERKR